MAYIAIWCKNKKLDSSDIIFVPVLVKENCLNYVLTTTIDLQAALL